jgi:hypothetical protein
MYKYKTRLKRHVQTISQKLFQIQFFNRSHGTKLNLVCYRTLCYYCCTANTKTIVKQKQNMFKSMIAVAFNSECIKIIFFYFFKIIFDINILKWF